MQVRLPGYPQSCDVVVIGPSNVIPLSGTIAGFGTLDFPGTIAAGGTFVGGPYPTGGVNHFSLSGTLSQTGSLEVLAFADPAGMTQTGTVAALGLTANAGAALDVNFGQIVQAVELKIVNTGGVAATLTNPAFAMSA